MGLWWGFVHVAAPLLLTYLVVPALIYLAPGAMQHVFFLNFVKLPFTDYKNLTAHNITSKGRNFYLEANDVTLGLWHVLPRTVSDRLAGTTPTDEELEMTLHSENFPVIVYLHGNSFDRTGDHRCRLYNVLSALDFHVIAVDYRGYGDSTGIPTENGIIQDANEAYQYALRMSGENSVYIWGHSMGTGVATKAAMDVSEQGKPPVGLILESPFNNLRDVVFNHPFTLPFRWMPWFDRIFVHPMQSSGLDMRTDERIVKVNCPILILHAEDDHIIPHHLASKLRHSAEEGGRDVTFVDFAKERRFRHKYIFQAQELADIISSFGKKCTAARLTELNRQQED
uniref:Serine aminopeptidase S33 domain-containing protein n=1 Tax=Plectus sambesii TaxID=2011161 RepID=A0A914WQA8_9BILA